MAQAAAGWYDQGDGTQRYWDGSAWTEHVAPSASVSPEPDVAPPAPPAPPVTAPPAPPAPVAAPPAPPAPIAAPPAAFAVPQSAQMYGAPVKKKKVWPWVVGIGGGLLLLVIGAIVLFVVVLSKASEGPREAVNAFDQAWRNGDCAALESTTTEGYREVTGWTDCEAFQAAGPSTTDGLSIKIVGFDVSGDYATVTTTETYPGDEGTYTGTYELEKVDGDWLITSVSLD